MNTLEVLQSQLSQVVKFLHIAERLKKEVRHGWLSNGRRESVAEHSWRLTLMVLLVNPYLDCTLNLERCLCLALLHDLAEAETGDTPVFVNQGADRKCIKYEQERQAMFTMTRLLDDPIGRQIYDLWEEYELQASYEAKVVRALDKLEAQLQHSEANLSTWLHQEKLMVFQPQWAQAHCDFDNTLLLLSNLIKNEICEKLEANGESVQDLLSEAEEEISSATS
jgi:putative hydrolases of HD superfamily